MSQSVARVFDGQWPWGALVKVVKHGSCMLEWKARHSVSSRWHTGCKDCTNILPKNIAAGVFNLHLLPSTSSERSSVCQFPFISVHPNLADFCHKGLVSSHC